MFSNITMTYPIAVILILGLYSHWYGNCFKDFMAISGKELKVIVYVIDVAI